MKENDIIEALSALTQRDTTVLFYLCAVSVIGHLQLKSSHLLLLKTPASIFTYLFGNFLFRSHLLIFFCLFVLGDFVIFIKKTASGVI